MSLYSTFQFLASIAKSPQIKINTPQIDSSPDKAWIDRQSLTEFCFGFTQTIVRSADSIGKTQKHMGFSGSGIDSDCLLEMCDCVLDLAFLQGLLPVLHSLRKIIGPLVSL